MAAYTGIIPQLPIPRPATTGAGNLAPVGAAIMGGGLSGGTKAAVLGTLVVRPGVTGAAKEILGQELWEKVVIWPRTKAMGFVLSTTSFNVDVWNTSRRAAQTLTAITYAGGGGVSAGGGPALPGKFYPFQSYQYAITVPQDGPATINDTVTWTFIGGIGGANLLVTGQRITVFSVSIDWADAFEEEIAYLTNVLPGYSGKEQRVQLRTAPRYKCRFTARSMSAKESAYMDAMLHSWQARVFGVPWWPDAVFLQADAAAGASVLTVPNITQRPSFKAGELVAVWRDWITWEAVTVLSVSTASITLSAPLSQSWVTGDLVLPLKRGRMAPMQGVDADASTLRSANVSFECEVV